MPISTLETREGADLFSPSELEGLRDFLKIYDAHYELLQKSVTLAVERHTEFVPTVKAIQPKVIEELGVEGIKRMRTAIRDGAWEPYWEQLRRDGELYAKDGLSSTTWFDLKTVARAEVTPLIVEEFKTAIPRLKICLQAMNKLFDQSLAVIGQEYDRVKELTIAKLAQSIAELSTPVLQDREGRLIMPLVGLIDTLRARQITEHLLQAIRTHRAKVVIIDITGVPAVDSRVANHLIQTVEAARLMGARAIVTGLSGEVALTLVTLGVDLSRVETVGDLQTGVEAADRILGFKLVKVE
jgi:rsbT co-antagonist protein RsbR